MDKIDLNKKYRTISRVMESVVQDCLYLLDSKKGVYFELNPTGTLIWQKLRKNPATGHELLAHLSEHFGILEDNCRKDLEVFLTDMLGRELIVEEEG